MTKTSHKQKALLEKLLEASNERSKFRFSRDFYTKENSSCCKVAKHPENHHKNSHNEWGFPFDHNLIQTIPEYINASPMRLGSHYYIAAQGPRKNTFDAFWQMVWRENTTLIVSLTNEIERKEWGVEFKFDRFWPEERALSFGEVKVEPLKKTLIKTFPEDRQERIIQRDFSLVFGNEQRKISHLHVENWPDRGVIHKESLIFLSEHIDHVKQEGSIVVHCAAGVGRTGTLIGFHSLYHDLLQHLSDDESLPISVSKRIEEMRKLRWGAVVAEAKQYDLIVEALKEVVQERYSP